MGFWGFGVLWFWGRCAFWIILTVALGFWIKMGFDHGFLNTKQSMTTTRPSNPIFDATNLLGHPMPVGPVQRGLMRLPVSFDRSGSTREGQSHFDVR